VYQQLRLILQESKLDALQITESAPLDHKSSSNFLKTIIVSAQAAGLRVSGAAAVIIGSATIHCLQHQVCL
jgi:Asp/Glu/hydantoin racemase